MQIFFFLLSSLVLSSPRNHLCNEDHHYHECITPSVYLFCRYGMLRGPMFCDEDETCEQNGFNVICRRKKIQAKVADSATDSNSPCH
ncbi:hypothetical protein DSO57_1034065 [Entomophthora muscae]|uniref:Uncharacterized protein n=2 Tax=Entomophthora muscae TaxID=34485 RepID=A0ACC2RQQ8_9FUNG|nr:hypothetical protein DSO57_1034207 [Entomophthora muscae]KAJ9079579.1 hypothetical protein DSO57_1034065 [Entomophthora muscae]